jgi:hypothetical protein
MRVIFLKQWNFEKFKSKEMNKDSKFKVSSLFCFYLDKFKVLFTLGVIFEYAPNCIQEKVKAICFYIYLFLFGKPHLSFLKLLSLNRFLC